MPENVKNTLFRFRSFRTPELIDDESKSHHFIQHPTGNTGHFYNEPPAATVRETMENAAASYSPLSKDDINGTLSPEIPQLIELGLYLIANRTRYVHGDVTPDPTSIPALPPHIEEQLWDDLFYQTITNESGYTREVIIAVLIANHMVNMAGALSPVDPDETFGKIANSKIVLPDELFKIENSYSTSTTASTNGNCHVICEKHVNAAMSTLKAEIAEKAKEELKKAEASYVASNETAELAAIQAHADTIETEVSNAAGQIIDVPYTDEHGNPATYRAYDETVSFSEYSFTPADQIDSGQLQNILSEDSFHLLEETGVINNNTFREVNQDLDTIINVENTSAFQNTEFSLESVDINGTLISTCKVKKTCNAYSYLMKAMEVATDKYAIFLCLDVCDPCTKIKSINIDLGGTVYTKFKASNKNGVVTMLITIENYHSIAAATTDVALSGSIELDNGVSLSFPAASQLNKANGTCGKLTDDDNLSSTAEIFIPSEFGLTRLGISEYRKVEQSLCRYVPGEVSHIENIMAREYKEKSTRRLRRSEDTTTTSSELESERVTDTSTATRFEMNEAVSEVLSQSQEYGKNVNKHLGGSLSANYGTALNGVSATVDASIDVATNFATSSSKDKSSDQSTNFAKDVTQKASDKVVSKVREERIIKIIEEFEENNRHGFDNRKGAKHISGVYRWVDKVYKNQIINFGKRLQYEFMIPEPSAFHVLAKSDIANSVTKTPLIKPLDPRKDSFGLIKPLKTAGDVTEGNYQHWAAQYGAEVSPPPPENISLSKVISKSNSESYHESVTEDVPIPEGYGLKKVDMSADVWRRSYWGTLNLSVADQTKSYPAGLQPHQVFIPENNVTDVDKYNGTIPVGVSFVDCFSGLVNVSMVLKRKHEHLVNWQLETYNAIMEAYEDRLAEYKQDLSEMENKKEASLMDNPAYFRQIENTVLKKNCISYLVGHLNMGKSFVSGNTSNNFHVNINEDMDKYAATIKFFEQAFEWDIMDYIFYPFYWANKNKWNSMYDVDSDDPTFRAFLQAGMARTIVTVRPGFEDAVMYYMNTGQIWNGGEVPVINNELHLSIVEEIKEPEYTLEETWETRVPSTLTLIQDGSIKLGSNELPNFCDITNASNDIEDSTVLDTLDIYIEGDQ